MSTVVVKANLFKQLRDTNTSIQRLQRSAQATTLKNVNTTGLTSADIDTAVFSNGSRASTNAQPADGITITDTTNNLLLVRQAGKWCKTSLTIID